MWFIEQQRARLETPQLVARLVLDQPQRGLFDLRFPMEGRAAVAVPDVTVFGLRCTAAKKPIESVEDGYVRSGSLTVNYRPCPEGIRLQVTWRCLSLDLPGVMGVECLVSVQTDRLDADPRVNVRSSLPAGGVLVCQADRTWRTITSAEDRPPAASSIVRCEVAETGIAYIELADPVDLCGFEVRFPSAERPVVEVIRELFPGRLEKGVIRRHRLWGCFLMPETDRDTAWELHDQFHAAAPPLTA